LASFPSVNNPEKSRNKPRKTVTTKNNEQEKNMSIENARAFYERVVTDETFREQISNVVNDEEDQNIIRGLGYDFTAKDWNMMTEQLSQSDESELNDAELEAVAGGFGFFAPMYGGGFPQNLFKNLLSRHGKK
jgi:predicted ribosomally synthesized peptide with nif11-like leader